MFRPIHGHHQVDCLKFPLCNRFISHLSKFFGDGLVFSFPSGFQLIIIFGNRVGSILSTCPYQMSCFRVISSNIVSGASIFSLIYYFVFLSSLEILADRLNTVAILSNLLNMKRRPLYLTLNLLTTTIFSPPSNASKWQMGFNSAFKGLRTLSVPRCKHFSPRL